MRLLVLSFVFLFGCGGTVDDCAQYKLGECIKQHPQTPSEKGSV